VLNGVSCISCHYAGIIPKNDEVGPTVRANPDAYAGFSEQILRLYKDKKISQFQQDDAERFQRSLAQIGIAEATQDGEPVFHMSKRFEISLDLKLAAAELGLTASDLDRHILATPSVGKVLGSLRLSNGTIKRDRFIGQFANLAVALGLGTRYEDHETEVAVTPPEQPKPVRDLGPLPKGFRTWHDQDGKKLFDAKVVSFDGSKGILQLTDGSTRTVGLDDVSDAGLEELLRHPSKIAAADLPELGPETPLTPIGGAKPQQAFESRLWMHQDGEEIIEAVLVDLKDGDVFLIPGPRNWTYKAGVPSLRSLHVIKFPRPGALGRGTLSIRLRDPLSNRVEGYTDLSHYSSADQEYIQSIEAAVTSGRFEDMTDPDRGYLTRYGILWKVSLNKLGEQDQQAAIASEKLLPKDDR
jgi:hypothetical protein